MRSIQWGKKCVHIFMNAGIHYYICMWACVLQGFLCHRSCEICLLFILLTLTVWTQHSASRSFPSGSVIKNLPASIGAESDVGSVPELGGSPGWGNGKPLQNSCLGSTVDRGVWQAIIHVIIKSRTWLSHLVHIQHLFIINISWYSDS